MRSRQWTRREYHVDTLIADRCSESENELIKLFDRSGIIEDIVDDIDENDLDFSNDIILFIFYEMLYPV